jgi:hypothetical protein
MYATAGHIANLLSIRSYKLEGLIRLHDHNTSIPFCERGGVHGNLLRQYLLRPQHCRAFIRAELDILDTSVTLLSSVGYIGTEVPAYLTIY